MLTYKLHCKKLASTGISKAKQDPYGEKEGFKVLSDVRLKSQALPKNREILYTFVRPTHLIEKKVSPLASRGFESKFPKLYL